MFNILSMARILLSVILLLASAVFLPAAACDVMPIAGDSLAGVPAAKELSAAALPPAQLVLTPDSLTPLPSVITDRAVEDRNWITLIRQHRYNIQDPTVEYPRFIGFCVKVYNWADTFFNGVDPEYVEGTGKRWKARLVSDNWVDSYAMSFGGKMSMRMMNNPYANVGAYLQYMAVSVGYSLNLNHTFGHKPVDHRRFEGGFSCARFNLSAYYTENTGGTYMRKLSGYHDNKLFKSYMPGLDLYTFGIDFIYFFNNRKYSNGAAYNFSKIQKRSVGSFIAGLSYSNQDISMDLSTLPPEILPYINIKTYFLKFHYYNFCAMFGYAYNWVINPHLLFNISAIPSLGINHCYEDSVEGTGDLFSMNIKSSLSLTYNLRNFFVCMIGKMDGHWYRSGKYSLFNSIENLQLSTGIRF